MKKKYKFWIILIIVVLIAVVSLTMAVRYAKGLKKEAVDARPVVKTCVPENRDIEIYTQQIGTVMPEEYVAVVPMLTGEVLTTHFNAGDRVNEGDLLCTIKYDGLDGLKISMDAAQISLDDATTALTRIEALYPTGAVSEQQLEQTRSAVKGAQLQYDAAKLQYDTYMKYTNVTAPISGVIESKGVDVHDFASPQTPVAVITADGSNKISFGVSEETANNLILGESVTVEEGGRKFSAVVTEIGSMISASGLHDVSASIKEGKDLTTGSRAKVTVIKSRAKKVITVPIEAVYYAGSEPFVYVLKDNKAVKTAFAAGINDGKFVEVKDGITESDEVICSWSNELYNGVEVIKSSNGQ